MITPASAREMNCKRGCRCTCVVRVGVASENQGPDGGQHTDVVKINKKVWVVITRGHKQRGTTCAVTVSAQYDVQLTTQGTRPE